MNTHLNLTIIQYNVNKSKDKVQHHFLQALNPKTHSIIAVQEPWINPHTTKPTTCNSNPGYYVCIPTSPNPRTCIYVSKEIDVTRWKQEPSPIGLQQGDVTSISLSTPQGKTWVHSIYNPPPDSHSSHTLNTLQWLQPLLQPEGSHITLGDFNLHHPRWGSDFLPAHHFLANHLNSTMDLANMDLATPKGTITWKARQSQSTVDLCFCSSNLTQTLTECTIADSLEASSDHLPIQTTFQIQVQAVTQEPRPQWKEAQWLEIKLQLQEDLKHFTERSLQTVEELDQAASDLTNTIWQAATRWTPQKTLSLYQKPYWTPACTAAVKAARRARRDWTRQNTLETWDVYNTACQAKKRQIKQDKLIGWRATVSEVTANPTKVWKLAKWARKLEEERTTQPQFPPIQDQQGNRQEDESGKAQALADHFFPAPVQADLQDLEGYQYPTDTMDIAQEVTEAQVVSLIKGLPSDKAPGPDRIPYSLLKTCKEEVGLPLAYLFTACLAQHHHPVRFKESNTYVLRKPQKEDYSQLKSYRPIALLNSIGKLLEKVVAQRLTQAVEQHNILPDTQMGGRAKRSVLTAMELLVEQVKTLWHTNSNKVASLLSLDIAGAFDNVSHARLLHILKTSRFPQWIVGFIQSFFQDRTTSMILGRYKGPPQPIQTGIPQGSTLSPILFLIFVKDLIPLLESDNSSASGFVDDTNILAWSNSTETNCKILETQHRKCETWAKQHGVQFAPGKYQLIHFTRKRTKHNLAATVEIQGHQTHPSQQLRVLGIWLDPRLRWGPQVKQARLRANRNMESINRLTASTWGATFHQAKVLYKAIVRPALLFGSQIWLNPEAGKNNSKPLTQPLEKLQNKCLRKITGCYKSTSTQVMEHETGIPPLDLYTQGLNLQYSWSTTTHPAQKTIEEAVRKIAQTSTQRRGRGRPAAARIPPKARDWARKGEFNIKVNPLGRKPAKSDAEQVAAQLWKVRWNQRPFRRRHRPAAEPQEWNPGISQLYRGLPRANASIAAQLRTEHIGFNRYLHRRRVPGYNNPSCTCGYHSQNVQHRLLTCPEWREGRSKWRQMAPQRHLQGILNNQADLKRITIWVIRQNWLEQFSLVQAVEDTVAQRHEESR